MIKKYYKHDNMYGRVSASVISTAFYLSARSLIFQLVNYLTVSNKFSFFLFQKEIRNNNDKSPVLSLSVFEIRYTYRVQN